MGRTAGAPNKTQRKSKVVQSEYAKFFDKLANEYGDLPQSSVKTAYADALRSYGFYSFNPMIQNNRIKSISSLPRDVGKDDLAEALQHPNDNEKLFRESAGILEYTAYPFYKIRTTYQSLLTYHCYTYPAFITKAEEAKSADLFREWITVTKLVEELQIQKNARKIVGQCIRDGKVFYVPRIDVDKAHTKIRSAFLQQLPQDWLKIVEFNNVSGYTIAFNMFYFLQPGTSPYQFGDLFEPYLDRFIGIFSNPVTIDKVGNRKIITASKSNLDLQKFSEQQQMFDRQRNSGILSAPELYEQNKEWFYWVYLPADKVWTFEIDDVKPTVCSPMTGLMLSMEQLSQYEQVQLEIVQNPLISMVLGQIETYDSTNVTNADPFKVSPTSRELFQSLFYQTMAMNNTNGIGIYSAPFKDMKLVQLAEAPNANNISSAGYEYAMEKSGMSALIPTNSEARAGVAQISLQIESQFAAHMYRQFERMMNVLIEKLNLKHAFRFKMFGTISEDEKLEKRVEKSMSFGILPDSLIYNALCDRSILDDISMSLSVKESGLLDYRIPLITSYTAKNSDGALPPKSSEGGRPSNEGVAKTDGNEQDLDE